MNTKGPCLTEAPPQPSLAGAGRWPDWDGAAWLRSGPSRSGRRRGQSRGEVSEHKAAHLSQKERLSQGEGTLTAVKLILRGSETAGKAPLATSPRTGMPGSLPAQAPLLELSPVLRWPLLPTPPWADLARRGPGVPVWVMWSRKQWPTPPAHPTPSPLSSHFPTTNTEPFPLGHQG